jgi:hypothetical protein
VLPCALTALAAWLLVARNASVAHGDYWDDLATPAVGAADWADSADEARCAGISLVSWSTDPFGDVTFSTSFVELLKSNEESEPAPSEPPATVDDDLQFTEELPVEPLEIQAYASDEWFWQWLPAGLIYRSYWAGVHEPRMAIVAFHEGQNRTLWDATLGGRVGLVRYGNCDPLWPQGYQLDFYGAAIARLDVENRQDLDSTDYVFGFPLTYGVGNWQFKLGYAHLSSHLGDELALRDPDTLDDRVNYVRDAIVFGVSCYPHPVWRQYAEAGWAFHRSGGAQPWEAQFGTELALPGPTGAAGTPFLAVNGRMREEHDFGGDLTVQAGWLRRGFFGQTLRLGVHYFNGKSSQFQFFDNSEEQIGLGLWYDF